MMDLITKKGTAALGTRLRRLSERLDRDVREIYLARGVAFETSWFPVVTALGEHGTLSVGELAALTGVSQPAISQIRKRLESEKLVTARVSTADQRRHELTLTARGRRLIDEAAPIWAAVAAVSAELCRIAAPNLLNELDAIERQLDAATMQTRVAAKLDQTTSIKSSSKGRRVS